MSETTESEQQSVKGGEFLVKDSEPKDIFIPEEFDEEARMMAQSCQDFLEAEIFPKLDAIDKQEEGLVPSLLDKAGELGLLGLTIPEEYGGFGKDLDTANLLTEVLGQAPSNLSCLSLLFSITCQ